MPDNSDTLIAKFVDGIEPGAIVTKYVLVAEGIDPAGKRAIYTYTDDDAMAQDVMGLLDYAIAREKAAIFKTAMKED